MKLFRSISVVLFAILVLVSSSSVMVGMHICKGDVKNIALFEKAESCQKEKALPPCHKHMKPACCEDETVYHEGTDFKGSIQHLHIVVPTSVDIEQAVVLISEIIPSTGSDLADSTMGNGGNVIHIFNRVICYAFRIAVSRRELQAGSRSVGDTRRGKKQRAYN